MFDANDVCGELENLDFIRIPYCGFMGLFWGMAMALQIFFWLAKSTIGKGCYKFDQT